MKSKKDMNDINGIIVINKEKGYTSHDVVAKLRKILNTRKIGHTGTLDPEATGVLPICIGKATKVSDMILNSGKEYTAKIKFGVTTDTQDIFGNVISQKEVNLSHEEIVSAIKSFEGDITQIPPMYSAIKIDGKKLYEYARKGIEVERKTRQVTINKIEISDVSSDSATIKVDCSKGTYIRTLCEDIGKKLGCGGCMESLARTRSSIFNIEKSVKIDDVTYENHQNYLIATDEVFSEYPKIIVNNEIKSRLINGAKSTIKKDIGMYRVYDEKGSFICVGEVEFYNGRNVVLSEKLFYTEGDL